MGISRRLKELALIAARDVSVLDVRIGLRYTAVLLDNGQVGLAFTFHRDSMGGSSALKDLTPLAGKKASELLALFGSTKKVESAVALATANALSNTTKEGLVEGDVLEHLRLSPNDRVGMVGYFAPMVSTLQRRASSLKIFEQIDGPEGDLLPEREAYKHLPNCQVVLITSTSIVNHTIDSILDAANSCREVALLGASTPLLSEAFAETPVTLLSGVVVTRPQEIMRIVSEGGGMRVFKNYISKVNLRLN
ncbi:MAG: DUF364 domain-containing protein [Pseudomonadota bacterium]